MLKATSVLIKPVIFITLGAIVGWVAKAYFQPNQSGAIEPLRVSGYKLIQPLLLCDSKHQDDSPSLLSIRNNIDSYLQKHIDVGNLSKISVYFRYLNSGEEFYINGSEQYFPASLQKLFMMMRIYKISETEPSILTDKRPLLLTNDANTGTIYPPREAPVHGQEYTADELISYMIKYSDNNSFNSLYTFVGKDKYEKIFRDLKLQQPELNGSDQDYITAYQLSLFFRMLYNASYLTNQNSEKALTLLTQTDYRRGLVKNLPPDVSVAHKYGVSTIKGKDDKWYGELHDCGIVYKGDNPYVLCIMTKSESRDITLVENAIAEISSITYQNAR